LVKSSSKALKAHIEVCGNPPSCSSSSVYIAFNLGSLSTQGRRYNSEADEETMWERINPKNVCVDVAILLGDFELSGETAANNIRKQGIRFETLTRKVT
jgi:hypothetical protein